MPTSLLRYLPWLISAFVGVGAWVAHYGGLQQLHPESETVVTSKTLGAMEWMARLDAWLYDQRVRYALEKQEPNQSFLMACIDDETIEHYKRQNQHWPLPRQLHGEAITHLTEAGAKAIAYDVVFSSSTRTGKVIPGSKSKLDSSDLALASALKKSGLTVLAARVSGRNPSGWPLYELGQSASALGHVNGVWDVDGVYRRIVPFYQSRNGDSRIWMLGLTVAAQVKKLSLKDAKVLPATWTQPRRLSLPREDRSQAPLVIPLDASGRFLVKWSIPWSKANLSAVPQLPYWKAVTGLGELAPQVKDKIVLVGSTSRTAQLDDAGPVPYHWNASLVTMHLNTAAAILDESFVLPCSRLEVLAWCLGLAALATLLTWQLRVEWVTLTVLALAAGYVLFSFYHYAATGKVLPIATPLLGALGSSHISVLTFRLLLERASAKQGNKLSTVVTAPDLVALVNKQSLPPGETKHSAVTLLYVDLSLPAHVTEDQVKNYQSVIQPVVASCGGSIQSGFTDSILAYWGTYEEKNHLYQAWSAVSQLERALAGLPPVRLVVHTGRALLGPSGSASSAGQMTVFSTLVTEAASLCLALRATRSQPRYQHQLVASRRTMNLTRETAPAVLPSLHVHEVDSLF